MLGFNWVFHNPPFYQDFFFWQTLTFIITFLFIISLHSNTLFFEKPLYVLPSRYLILPFSFEREVTHTVQPQLFF